MASTTARKIRIRRRTLRAIPFPKNPRDLLGARVCSPASEEERGTIVSVAIDGRDLCSVRWDHAVPGAPAARSKITTLRRID